MNWTDVSLFFFLYFDMFLFQAKWIVVYIERMKNSRVRHYIPRIIKSFYFSSCKQIQIQYVIWINKFRNVFIWSSRHTSVKRIYLVLLTMLNSEEKVSLSRLGLVSSKNHVHPHTLLWSSLHTEVLVSMKREYSLSSVANKKKDSRLDSFWIWPLIDLMHFLLFIVIY